MEKETIEYMLEELAEMEFEERTDNFKKIQNYVIGYKEIYGETGFINQFVCDYLAMRRL